ncbi:MAG TPA: ABC-three component system protein [Thermoanaerobaculia bacterium]|jgi:hypothetical protein|nr:ABC-three component system protein [Thermoanaerobaculia bacterium]
MKYAYEDLSWEQFETLIVLLCQKLFGISVQGFSPGPDGSRDAKFVGTADHYPSDASPWVGTTIIQAKHTNGYNRSFSEYDFFGAKGGSNTVIGKELPRITRLRKRSQLDHYILFANRRLAGEAESVIRAHIATNCAIPESSIGLCGVERLELWLRVFPDVPKHADLDPLDSPLIVSSVELAEIVQAFARQRDEILAIIDDPPTARLAYDQKNTLNNMTPEYAKELRGRYLKDTAQIKTFLAAPENLELQRLYESVVEEFQHKIIANRKAYQTFDQVMIYLADQLFARDVVLRQLPHKRLTRTVLFYMYWNCDIGRSGDVATD